MSLDFVHEFVDTSATRWEVALLDSGEKQLAHFYAKGSVTSVNTEDLNLEAGTYYVKVSRGTQMSNVKYGVTVHFSNPTSLKKCTVTLSGTSLIYNGKAQKPSVTVKNGAAKLILGTDYTISYKNNKAVGKAYVTIKGTGAYKDAVTRTFKIVPKGTSISSLSGKSKGFTVKWKKQSTQTTGYQIQYSLSSTFKSSSTVTVKGTGTLKKTIFGLKKGKKYYVRIRTYKTVSGTKYYSSWSKAKTVKTKLII